MFDKTAIRRIKTMDAAELTEAFNAIVLVSYDEVELAELADTIRAAML
jgi:hypothetical protein